MRDVRKMSCGYAHSQKIKNSARWHDHLAKVRGTPVTRPSPEEESEYLARAKRSQNRQRKPDYEALFRILGYSPEAYRRDVQQAYRQGYVQALRDVRREREKLEAASYQEALGDMCMQDAVAVSAKYDVRHRGIRR